MLVANRSHRRPGPKPGELVHLDTKITPELNRGLNDLVNVSGHSKASLVRRAIAALLADSGTLPPEYPGEIGPTPTSGPGLSAHRKDKS